MYLAPNSDCSNHIGRLTSLFPHEKCARPKHILLCSENTALARPDSVARLRCVVKRNPRRSIRKRVSQLGMSRPPMHGIYKSDLRLIADNYELLSAALKQKRHDREFKGYWRRCSAPSDKTIFIVEAVTSTQNDTVCTQCRGFV